VRIVKRALLVVGFVVAAIGVGTIFRQLFQDKGANMTQTQTMQISSPAFQEGVLIPVRYTCKGDNVSPPLIIINVPGSSKSLALIVHDPDAVNADWTHWLVWNIPPITTEIAENTVPAEATQGITDFGTPGYGGPCPPSGTGTHHYSFELYALDTMLDLDSSAKRIQLEQAMAGHVLGQAKLIGTFGAD